jgi:CrcB protein
VTSEVADAPVRLTPGTVVAVALGGALGAVARYEVARSWPVAAGTFPWTTLGINLVGAFVLGVVLTVAAGGSTTAARVRAFAAIGFCGGFTTFSTWMVEVVLLGRDGDVALGAAYSSISIALGLVAIAAGVLGAHWLFHDRIPRFDPRADD